MPRTFCIQAIHHVSLLVDDLPRALGFYQQVLGLVIDPQRPDTEYPGAWLNLNDQQLHLLQLPDPHRENTRCGDGGRDRHLALQVTDLQPLIARLQQQQIDYTLSRSGRQALFCRDPAGNALEFVEA